ncbi:hypothetical protein IC582_007968 [Cucumis melo]
MKNNLLFSGDQSRDDLSTSQSSILHMKVPLRCDHSRSSHPVKACGERRFILEKEEST